MTFDDDEIFYIAVGVAALWSILLAYIHIAHI